MGSAVKLPTIRLLACLIHFPLFIGWWIFFHEEFLLGHSCKILIDKSGPLSQGEGEEKLLQTENQEHDGRSRPVVSVL
jgi:hypothetical protein